MDKKSWQNQLEDYRKEAYKYFSDIGICPDGEDIVEFVCDAVEDASSCEVDDGTFFAIARRKKMKEFYYKQFKTWSFGIYSNFKVDCGTIKYFGLRYCHIGFVSIAWGIPFTK
jgi:hypothetical protein